MTTRTEYLEGADKIHYRITDTLHSWVQNEGNNLEGFINNPSEHVNHNPYMIMNFSKLSDRLTMLRKIEQDLFVITEYKKGNPNYSATSMYEYALDEIDVQLLQRLQDWLQKRFSDMKHLISSSKSVDAMSPIHDYVGMYTFNQPKFMQEYNMYALALKGCQAVIEYKTEIGQAPHVEQIITTNEPPQGA